ncbi:MAG: CNT family concentrative nucleoside transporter, partial [Flavobacteriales bacterium]
MRAILGVVILVAIAWALSSDRKKINWVTVGGAFGLQLILAVLILKVPFVNTGFDWLA